MDETIRALTTPGKGLLAADESLPSIAKRFDSVGIPSTEETRRQYRHLLLTAPDVGQYISGVILFSETLRQRADDGRLLVKVLEDAGIVPGIKVDLGAVPLALAPGERITEGLDGLRERLGEYRALGAQFAKWRAVITIGQGLPSAHCLAANGHALARYAALCQEAGVVPIVEPEVLMDGDHSLERALEVTEATLAQLFLALRVHHVSLERVLLKPNMVVPGTHSARAASSHDVAAATVAVLRRSVPAAVPGIVFLSGGQDAVTATKRLNAISVAAAPAPWFLSFSFARALQQPALEAWRGLDTNVAAAQHAFLHRARCNAAAQEGRYDAAMEALAAPDLAHRR